MGDELDFQLAGDFIRYELEHHPPYHDVSKLSRKVGVDRGVMHNFLNGFAGTRTATLRRIEAALDLPEYTIDLVREKDLEGLASMGLDDRPMRWLHRRIEQGGGQDQATPGRSARNHRAV